MPHHLRRAALAVLFVASAAVAADLQPFRMPWDDASAGVTNLQAWQPHAAGADGWVTVTPDGHYAVGGERIRFLGASITSVSAFPSADQAAVHAARLARFGFNAVRFHHLEAPWDRDKVLIDYASGSSRSLSADRLDRLHFFVARLAAHGIYSNINLLVSREFQPADGLGAEIAQMNWKDQHILGFFNDAALALHQEHATKLLTAPNPYRSGLPLDRDPAVAFVEIMNENGLMQKWFEGVLDTMPALYRLQLEAKWNQWLAGKYASTAALLAGWGTVDTPLGANLLANGNFASGAAGWNAEQHAPAVASFTGTADFNGQPALRIMVSTGGSADWHVQLNQAPIALQNGALFTLSFWAKADGAVPLYAGLTRSYGDYGSIGAGLDTTLSTAWQQFTLTVQAEAAETNARVNFGGFGSRLCSVWLADVRFQPGGKIGGLPAGRTLEGGNVPCLLRNNNGAAYSMGQRTDWTRFVLGCEAAYWAAMYHHVKMTLGYPGIIWGTIIANSPPNTQAVFDAMDSHAYWQHPTWPTGHDWDPDLWTINNVSMVNDPAGGTLGGLARQRVQGRPHNVTEYQHPSPNTYGSEGPLLAAAYGALQDWDSLWLFSYEVATAESEYVNSFFDHGAHPGKMANNLIAAAMFRRADVAAGRKTYTFALTPDREVDLVTTRGAAWSVTDGAQLGVPAALALTSRISLSIGARATGLPTIPAAPTGNAIASDTSELNWDNSRASQGVVTVNTARTKAVIGFTAGRAWELGGVRIAPGTTRQDWTTIGVSLLEGMAFDHATGGRAVIVTTGDCENTGMVWKDTTRSSVGTHWGGAPVLIEVIQATIWLPVPAGRVSAWALDARGQRLSALTVADDAGRAKLQLGTNGTTLWYEVVIAPGVAAAPTVSVQPMSVAVPAGSPARLSAGFDGAPAPTVQWYRNGGAIPGATSVALNVTATTAGDTGTYHAVATNSAGTVSTREVRVGLREATGGPPAEQLINLSTRASVRTGAQVVIAGFVVSGGTREVLLRAVGPTLSGFGIQNPLLNPTVELFRWNETVPWQTNDDWDPVATGDLFQRLGAFALTSPREACLRLQLPAGIYTAVVAGAGGGIGTGIVELYDVGGAGGRLVNLSTRGRVGQGEESLIAGFVVNGSEPKQVLIRGIGPALADYGVTDATGDPVMTLHKILPASDVVLRANDDWDDDGAGPAVAAQSAAVGAFPLPTLSRDASLLVWLEPGIFTAVLNAKTTPGVGLIEIYELP